MPIGPKMAVNSVLGWFLVFASCIAAGFTGREEVIQMELTWGMINASLPCLPDEEGKFDPQSGFCYWEHVGANGESTELHTVFKGERYNMTPSSHLGSQNELVLHRVDWSSMGLYICDYSSHEDESFSKTTVNVTVRAPSAVIEECDSSETPPKTELCRISPKSARMVNITCSKRGLLDPAVRFRAEYGPNVYLSVDHGRREFPETDGSTRIIHRFEVGVDQLKSEGDFTCVLEDKMHGISIEEVSAILHQRTESDDKDLPPDSGQRTGHVSTSGVSLAVVVPTGICVGIIIIAWLVVRHVRRRRSQPEHHDGYHPGTLELADDTSCDPAAV